MKLQQPPEGASLGGHSHGDTVTEQTALHLVGLPGFADHWAIPPSVDGSALTLIWGDSCTLDELGRVNEWISRQAADFEADGQPRGSA